MWTYSKRRRVHRGPPGLTRLCGIARLNQRCSEPCVVDRVEGVGESPVVQRRPI